MKNLLVDFRNFSDAEMLHPFLAYNLQMPEYYGENLDALFDVLSTYSEDLTIHYIPGESDFEEGFLQVFRDAAAENRHLFCREERIAVTLEELMEIDSPSGFSDYIEHYLMEKFAEMGVKAETLRKGGILCELGSGDDAILLMAHGDTLGAVVGKIKDNGHLQMSNVTLNAQNIEAHNCSVFTEDGRIYSGTVQLTNPSIHVNGKFSETERNFDTLEVVLDEEVSTKEETEELGIRPGDVVAVSPDFTLTAKGYVKSRYLDDKASVAILLDFARDVSEGKIKLNRKVYLLITLFEEYGQGGACGIPEDVTDILCVDMGCVGEDLNCTEKQVSICRKDRRNVYHRGLTSELIAVAEEAGISYAVDVYPYYSSDANVAMEAGFDVRHALIGPGVYASHGYERTHLEAIHATKRLLTAFLSD